MAQRQFRSDDTSFWIDKYGDGSDGPKTVTSHETYDGANAGAAGTASSTSLTIDNASTFADGDLVLIHQTRGTGAGSWELNKISSGGGTTSLTLSYSLINTYTDSGASQAQILELKEYTSLTVNSSVTFSAAGWDGNKGGIIAFVCNGTTSINGTVSAAGAQGGIGAAVTTGGGFLGGARVQANNGNAGQGESTTGAGSAATAANGSGGGGGQTNGTNRGQGAGGGGGAHFGTGSSGTATSGASGSHSAGSGSSSTTGVAALTTLTFGGGGGGSASEAGASSTPGGNGGGIIFIISRTLNINSGATVTAKGGNTETGAAGSTGGGGAGGSILFKVREATINGAASVLATAGIAGVPTGLGDGGDAGTGRIHIDYGVSVSGTTSPAADTTLDITLAEVVSDVSVKANIKRAGLDPQANSVKANILRAGLDTKANSVKAFLPTYIKDNSVKAYIPTQQHSHTVKGNIYSPFIEKRFDYRIYNQAGTEYINSWGSEILSEPTFRTTINGGPGEMVIRLGRSFDDFGEDEDIAINNTVKVYVFDRDAVNGILLYSGFISGYRPVLDGQKEYIEVTVLHRVAELNNFMLRDGTGSTQVAENSQDPSQMFKDIINYYRADGGKINYTASSVDLTGSSASYTFQVYTVKEALDKAIELTPEDWYWRVDPDNILHLHEGNTDVADHTFLIGKHISYMETWRRGEDIVNRVYFVGQGDPPMYRVYSNTGSIDTYGIHAIKVVDQRVTASATADILANRIINRQKDPEIRTSITILDNNGINLNKGYDIESIKVGQTMRIRNINQGTRTTSAWDIFQWDVDVWDQTLAFAAADVLQILTIEYTPNGIRIEASSRIPEISKRVEEIYRNLEQTQVYNAPASPTAG